jgi:hypothetical protein
MSRKPNVVKMTATTTFRSRRSSQGINPFTKEGYSYGLSLVRPLPEDVLPPGTSLQDIFKPAALTAYLNSRTPPGQASKELVTPEWFQDYRQCHISREWADKLQLHEHSTILLFAINSKRELRPFTVQVDVIEENAKYGPEFFWLPSGAVDDSFEPDRITVNRHGPDVLLLTAKPIYFQDDECNSPSLASIIGNLLSNLLPRRPR